MSDSTPKNRKLTTEEFITRAILKHGDKYSYSKSVYTRAKNKIIITCAVHGDFEQEAFSHMSGCGCNLCYRRNLSSSFEVESRKIHGDDYDYSLVEYKTNAIKVKIICKIHGEFSQSPMNHLAGKRCNLCASASRTRLKTFPFEEFERISNNTHNFMYKYCESHYAGIKSNTKIICSEHGEFHQTAKLHMNGGMCPGCISDGYGFKLTSFKKMCDSRFGGNGVLYLIKCYGNNEEFYKIGITSRGSKHRFDSKSRMPYGFEVIKEITANAETIYKLEKFLHKILRGSRYKPLIKFGGYTECFSEISVDVIAIIDKMSNNDQLQLLV